MHAENGMAIDVVAADWWPRARQTPTIHGVARYPIFEGEATNQRHPPGRSRGRCRVYIVHLSARDALDEVRAARDRLLPCTRKRARSTYFLSLDDMADGFNGANFISLPRYDRPITRLSYGRVWSRNDLQVGFDRPLSFRLPRPEAARRWGLPEGAEWAAWGGGSSRPDARWWRPRRPPDPERWVEVIRGRAMRGCSALPGSRASWRLAPMQTSSSTTARDSTPFGVFASHGRRLFGL
jgi:hypothetical protein